MKRAVFLDRDGVINAMHYEPEHGLVDSPLTPDHFKLLPGVGEALGMMEAAGFLRVVVSNQPVVAKGKTTLKLVDAITERMKADLARSGARIDAVYYCLHHPQAEVEEYRIACECRKPRPGLLTRAGRELDIDLSASFMIGDGLVDVQAGTSAGCRTIWLGEWRCDWCRVIGTSRPDHVATTLKEAAHIITGA